MKMEQIIMKPQICSCHTLFIIVVADLQTRVSRCRDVVQL